MIWQKRQSVAITPYHHTTSRVGDRPHRTDCTGSTALGASIEYRAVTQSRRTRQSPGGPMASLLDTIGGPADLRGLSDEQLETLASQVRERLIASVAQNGGHLGPNLGVVELTLAMHRVFDSPRDRIVFDTGHQAYVHKMLTGRAVEFDRL